MLIKYVSLLPEIILSLMLVTIALVHWLRQEQTPKTFATISKIGIFASFVACIIFYNIGLNEKWYINTPYTTFFKGLVLLGVLLTNFLACKWFLSQNYASHKYYFIVGLISLVFCAAISAQNIVLMFGMVVLGIIAGEYLSIMSREPSEKEVAGWRYFQNNLILCLFLGIGVALIGWHSGEWSYSGIVSYYKQTKLQGIDIFGGCFIISGMLGLMGVAPFHLNSEQTARYNILPVVVFSETIPVITGVALLVTIFHTVLNDMQNQLSVMMKLCGILSVIFGAIGTGSSLNIRKIYQNVGLFNIGVVLLLFSYLGVQDIQAGLIYFLIYLLSIFGIFSCFYGLCSHGEYVNNLENLSGIKEVKPYISAALLIFSISLLGVPPLVGLLGNLSLINTLLAHHSIGMIGFVCFMLVVLAHGILKVIKTIYFDKRKMSFDRADKGVYFSLLINIIIILVTMMNPQYLINDIQEIIHSFL